MSRHAIYCHLFDTNNPCLPCRVARCHPLSIAFESPRGIRRSFRLMAPPLPLPPSSPSIGSAERSLLFFILFILLSLSLSPRFSPPLQTIGQPWTLFNEFFFLYFISLFPPPSLSSSSSEYPRTCTLSSPPFFPRDGRLNRSHWPAGVPL